jgi:predicted ester cyclase
MKSRLRFSDNVVENTRGEKILDVRAGIDSNHRIIGI